MHPNARAHIPSCERRGPIVLAVYRMHSPVPLTYCDDTSAALADARKVMRRMVTLASFVRPWDWLTASSSFMGTAQLNNVLALAALGADCIPAWVGAQSFTLVLICRRSLDDSTANRIASGTHATTRP